MMRSSLATRRTLGRAFQVVALLVTVTVAEDAAAGLGQAPDPVGIFGGQATPTCGWPSVVALGGCTGTLIHPEIIAYAAHCGDEVENVWFGETQFEGDGFSVPTEFCMTSLPFALGEGNDFAFCKLAEPVTNVPFTPPLMGCETTLLTAGREVVLVGFGAIEDETSGVKHQLTTTLNGISDGQEAQTGTGNGNGVCFGDSGGPAFVRLDESVGGDGSWRAFGIASYIQGGACGNVGYHTLIHNAVSFIEANSGIDVTPCHYTGGVWNPTPNCDGFELEPDNGAGKSWEMGCRGGPTTEVGASCGPGFDASLDALGPVATIVEPSYGAVFDSDDDSGTASVDVLAEAVDEVSGVVSVGLRVQGELPENGLDFSPPWAWGPVRLPPGIWELSVVSVDYAGNESISDPVVIGVDMRPPPAPEPETGSSSGEGSTGVTSASESSTGAGQTGSAESSTTGSEATTGGGTGDATSSTGPRPDPLPPSSGQSIEIDDDGGCGCRSGGGGAPFAFAFGLLALGLRRRR